MVVMLTEAVGVVVGLLCSMREIFRCRDKFRRMAVGPLRVGVAVEVLLSCSWRLGFGEQITFLLLEEVLVRECKLVMGVLAEPWSAVLKVTRV